MSSVAPALALDSPLGTGDCRPAMLQAASVQNVQHDMQISADDIPGVMSRMQRRSLASHARKHLADSYTRRQLSTAVTGCHSKTKRLAEHTSNGPCKKQLPLQLRISEESPCRYILKGKDCAA